MPSLFSSHFKSRVPPHCKLGGYCSCGRKKDDYVDCCSNCLESMEVVICAKKKELSPNVFNILESVKCSTCSSQFADEATLANLMSKVSFCLYHLLLIRALLLVA